MTYTEALEKLIQGYRVARDSWMIEDYLFSIQGEVKTDGGDIYKFTQEDKEAKDWILEQMRKKPNDIRKLLSFYYNNKINDDYFINFLTNRTRQETMANFILDMFNRGAFKGHFEEDIEKI